MAEVRKHQQDDADGLGKLVRDALGERIRPSEPGRVKPTPDNEAEEDSTKDTGPSASSLSSWMTQDGGFTF